MNNMALITGAETYEDSSKGIDGYFQDQRRPATWDRSDTRGNVSMSLQLNFAF